MAQRAVATMLDFNGTAWHDMAQSGTECWVMDYASVHTLLRACRAYLDCIHQQLFKVIEAAWLRTNCFSQVVPFVESRFLMMHAAAIWTQVSRMAWDLVKQQGVRAHHIPDMVRVQKFMQLTPDCKNNYSTTNEASRHVVALAVSASILAGL